MLCLAWAGHDYVVKGGSLASNLKVLCGKSGRGKAFRVARMVPVDLFPHTPHCELCVLCVRAPFVRPSKAEEARQQPRRSSSC